MSMTTRIRHAATAIAALAVMGALAPHALAKGPMSICKGDIEKLCASAGKGSERLKCLKENEAQLSPDCQATMKDWKATRGALRSACKEDRKTLCKDAKGGAKKCLLENQAKLSKPCAEALAQAPGGKG